MEFMTGKKEKEVLDLGSRVCRRYGRTGSKGKRRDHECPQHGRYRICDSPKRDGVLQTVYEKGVTDADFAELREETFAEVSGVLRKEERAPRGMELRLKSVRSSRNRKN